MLSNKLWHSGLIALAVLFATSAHSADDEKLLIDADNQQVQLKNNVLVFSQNVLITHGKRTIKADHLKAYSRKELGPKNEILVATGKPASYSEALADGTTITASADEIRYDVAKAMLTITGNAQITQSGQQINAETIVYDIDKQIISANKKAGSNDRVHTVLDTNSK